MLTSFLSLLLIPFDPSVLTAHVAHAEAAPLPDWTSTTTIEAYVKAVQIENGLDNLFYETLRCESMNWLNIQSTVPSVTGPNAREDSWGVAQFHLPAKNKDSAGTVITKEMALIPKLAIDAAAWHFKEGRARLWTCYKDLVAKGGG